MTSDQFTSRPLTFDLGVIPAPRSNRIVIRKHHNGIFWRLSCGACLAERRIVVVDTTEFHGPNGVIAAATRHASVIHEVRL